MVLGESAGVAAAMAVDAEIPVQDVPYKKLRQKLDDLDQTLDRIQGPIKDQKTQGTSGQWKSQEAWDKQKKGWEWLFPHIDTDSDGQISAEEYNAFQKYKAKHKNWEDSLRKKKAAPTPRKKGVRTPAGQLEFPFNILGGTPLGGRLTTLHGAIGIGTAPGGPLVGALEG